MRRKTDAYRSAEAVRWASLIERPNCIPMSKHRGAKAAGLRYERAFAKQFPQSLHGQWFEYEDKHGLAYCQPDLIVSLLPICLIVFEVKYTLTDEAFHQLNHLYLPVVQAAMEAPVFGVAVCKNLVPIRTRFTTTSSFEDAVNQSKAGSAVVLHWVGQSMSHTHPLTRKPKPPFQMQFPQRIPKLGEDLHYQLGEDL